MTTIDDLFHIFLKVASTVLDRVSDVSRVFPATVDIGCGRGHFAKHLGEDASDLIGSLYQCDIAERAVVRKIDNLIFFIRC